MDRPDSHGPLSLTDERTLAAGQFELGVKYINHRFEGQGIGTDSLPVSQVLTMFDVSPTVSSTTRPRRWVPRT
jgi:hypothetical protein